MTNLVRHTMISASKALRVPWELRSFSVRSSWSHPQRCAVRASLRSGAAIRVSAFSDARLTSVAMVCPNHAPPTTSPLATFF